MPQIEQFFGISLAGFSFSNRQRWFFRPSGEAAAGLRPKFSSFLGYLQRVLSCQHWLPRLVAAAGLRLKCSTFSGYL